MVKMVYPVGTEPLPLVAWWSQLVIFSSQPVWGNRLGFSQDTTNYIVLWQVSGVRFLKRKTELKIISLVTKKFSNPESCQYTSNSNLVSFG